MKQYSELEIIFSNLIKNKSQSEEIEKNENWSISIFRPFERDNIITYHFRLYCKVTNSKFLNYNNKLQYCGDVYYSYNSKTKDVTRNEKVNLLHPIIKTEVNILQILNDL
jgi:hypothetical protein